MSSDEPELRIGNVERDEAVRLLKQQAADGRLGPEELSERADQVRRARTRAEMMPAFADLPVDVPVPEQDAFPLYPGTDPVTGAAAPTGQELAVPADTTRPATLPSTEDRIDTSPATKRIGAAVIALLWPAAFVLNMVLGWHLWWVFMIPVFASGWIAYAFGLADRPDGSNRHRDRRHGRGY